MSKQPYAIITGASSGIGKAFASILANNAHNLILVARDKEALEEVKTSLNNKVDVRIVNLDLTDLDSGKKLENYIQKYRLDINILINNAGFGDYAKFQNADQGKLLNMIDLNIRSLTELTHRFLPYLLKQKKSHVLNVASMAAFFPGPSMAVYYASKHYVLAFSEGLYEELKHTGVGVTTLCPGPTASGFQAAASKKRLPLFENRKLPSSESVAEFGYKAMLARKPVAIPNVRNKLAVQVTRLLSRSTMRKIVNRAHNQE